MLENALDYGISEEQFWNMTFGELDRLVASRKRMEEYRNKERATFDYIHAALVGRAFAAGMDSKAKFPELYEAYPSLFDKQESEDKRQEQLDQLSALRLKQFVQFHNQRFREVANDK